MKSIDVKSLLIGTLLTSTIFLGVAAVPKDTGKSFSGPNPPRSGVGMQWDDKQVWQVRYINGADIAQKGYEAGWEVFSESENGYSFRRRIK